MSCLDFQPPATSSQQQSVCFCHSRSMWFLVCTRPPLTPSAHPVQHDITRERRICWVADLGCWRRRRNKNGMTHSVPRFAFYRHFCFWVCILFSHETQVVVEHYSILLLLLFLSAVGVRRRCRRRRDNIFVKWNESSPSHTLGRAQLKTICRYSHKGRNDYYYYFMMAI